jgi:hypothetical protein
VRSEQRILGREGVAGITIDGRADQIATITAALPEIGRMVTFAPGKAYGDFVAGTDPAPAYDLPSLLTLKSRPADADKAPSAETAAEPGTAARDRASTGSARTADHRPHARSRAPAGQAGGARTGRR